MFSMFFCACSQQEALKEHCEFVEEVRPTTQMKRILLVSDNLPHHEILIEAARDDVIVVPVQYSCWDLDTLTQEIYQRAGPPSKQYASVGLLDHGEAGEFCLLEEVEGGSLDYNEIRLNPELKGFFRFLASYVRAPKELGRWREDLDSRIDLMACCVAANEEGRDLIRYLEDITRVNWAASTDETGAGANAEGGFDWIMETEVGLGSVHECYFNEKIKQWQHTMKVQGKKAKKAQKERKARWANKATMETATKEGVTQAAKDYMDTLMESVKDENDIRTLRQKHDAAAKEATGRALQKAGTKAGNAAMKTAINKGLAYSVAKSSVGAVTLQGGRRGGIVVATTAGKAATRVASGAAAAGGANAAARVLSKATPVQFASLAGELAGKYVIAAVLPIDEELAGFLGSVGAGAGAGGCFGGPFGAAGGAVVGAGSWVIGWAVEGTVSTLTGTEQNDMSFRFPGGEGTSANCPFVPFQGESTIFSEKIREEGGIGSFCFTNQWDKEIVIPDGHLVTNLVVESHWKDGSNGHAEITQIVDGKKQGPTFPLVGPAKLNVHIEALRSRGFDWSVTVKSVNFEQATGQKL